MNIVSLPIRALPIALLSLLACTAQAQTFPPHNWASKDGLVQLKPNGMTLTTSNVLDRLLIQETLSRWGIAWDETGLDVVRSLFTKDGELILTLGSDKPIGRLVGPEAIAKYVEGGSKIQGDQRRHAITNVVIESLTDTEATAIAYGIVTIAADGLSLGATVIYTAKLHKEADGAWRFSKFVIGMDEYAGRTAAANAAFEKLGTHLPESAQPRPDK